MKPDVRISIVGATGYTGGELVRLLLHHHAVSIAQVTSRSQAGRFVHATHPNLRGHCTLKFVDPDALEPCDILLLCMPHGEAASQIDRLSELAPRIIDLSADFRLDDASAYEQWYGQPHAAPQWLERFIYGLPETRRDAIASATHVSGVGCNATAVNLAMLPLARAGLIQHVIVDVKVGSSESGASHNAGSHHPERAGAVRSFAPTGHRHQAEITQELGLDAQLHMSVTSVELVRGALCTAHVLPTESMDTKQVWAMYRRQYADEPFVRIVKERRGIHRYPDPKILAGSNHVDIGFDVDDRTGRIVVISAIDNLMKGAAGSAVQCMNLMLGLDEITGLGFPGLHPI